MAEHVLNQKDLDLDRSVTVTVGYGLRGEEISPEDALCCAKRSDLGGGVVKHYIKHPKHARRASIAVRSSGNFYNPASEEMGRPDNYEFRQVTENAFSLYVQFLKTRNFDFLRHAEREQ